MKIDLSSTRPEEVVVSARDIAAVHIQKITRGFNARHYFRRARQQAMEQSMSFWNIFHDQREEKNAYKRALKARIKTLSVEFTEGTLNATVTFVLHTMAAVTIQRYTRGYIMRRYHMPYPRRQGRPVSRPPRHDMAAWRRLWARKHWVPEGGWPGRAGYEDFDMWQHIYRPPKGLDFGRKTFKVPGIPDSKQALDALLGDEGSWIGVPYKAVMASQARRQARGKEKEILLTSPFGKKQYPGPSTPPPAKLMSKMSQLRVLMGDQVDVKAPVRDAGGMTVTDVGKRGSGTDSGFMKVGFGGVVFASGTESLVLDSLGGDLEESSAALLGADDALEFPAADGSIAAEDSVATTGGGSLAMALGGAYSLLEGDEINPELLAEYGVEFFQSQMQQPRALPPDINQATPLRGGIKPLSIAHKRAIVAATNGAIPQGIFVDHMGELMKRSVASSINAQDTFGIQGVNRSYATSPALYLAEVSTEAESGGQFGVQKALDHSRIYGRADGARAAVDLAASTATAPPQDAGGDELPPFDRARADAVASHIGRELDYRRNGKARQKREETFKIRRALKQTPELTSLAWRTSAWGRLKTQTELTLAAAAKHNVLPSALLDDPTLAAPAKKDHLADALERQRSSNSPAKASVESPQGKGPAGRFTETDALTAQHRAMEGVASARPQAAEDGTDAPLPLRGLENAKRKKYTGPTMDEEERRALRVGAALAEVTERMDLNLPMKKKKKDVVAKVRVWTKPAKEHYKFRYSWLPQPLLHEAAKMVYKGEGATKYEGKRRGGVDESTAFQADKKGGNEEESTQPTRPAAPPAEAATGAPTPELPIPVRKVSSRATVGGPSIKIAGPNYAPPGHKPKQRKGRFMTAREAGGDAADRSVDTKTSADAATLFSEASSKKKQPFLP
jgi:hypothetical protein